MHMRAEGEKRYDSRDHDRNVMAVLYLPQKWARVCEVALVLI
jgi:hypothetical protein